MSPSDWNTALAKDELSVLREFRASLPLDGAEILEVGGAIPPDVVASLPVARWCAIDPRNTRTSVGARYEVRADRVERCDFPDCSFDLVFSSNALHLINPLDAALRQLARMLRPGGRLFAQFGPIWSAPDGHQLEQVFVDGRELLFWRDFLIPHWWHLIFDAEELRAILGTRLDAELAAAVAHHVHSDGWVNRLFLEDYLEVFLASGLTLINLRAAQELDYRPAFPDYEHPLLNDGRTHRVRETVRTRNGGRGRDLLSRDLTVILAKLNPDEVGNASSARACGGAEGSLG